eukprot:COSAG06_NODE_67519_length_251_cov_1.980263_1_plen_37_part_10
MSASSAGENVYSVDSSTTSEAQEDTAKEDAANRTRQV